MTSAALLNALAHPAAYPFPVDRVEVHHTHISVVFLAGALAYKIKKPVQLGFVDFGTLEKRLHFCQEEVRLNRRLAPAVYLDVVPIARTPGNVSGVLVEGQGEVLEWAVKMVRLPPDSSLEQRLLRGTIGTGEVTALARQIASFHARAETSARIAAGASFARVAKNALDNFDQARSHVGDTISPAVYERTRRLTEVWLERLRPLIERRAREGKPRDTHGDLRLEHVYYFPDQPPLDPVIIDCIEFNESFRHADPIADMAFLFMDLLFHDRPLLANAFAQAYFQASEDEEGRPLLPFYTAYRAAVRAKVEGMEAQESEVPPEERTHARLQALAHWLMALGLLEEPRQRPALVLVGGLPGSGKSTLALALAEQAGFEVIRSDVVRKELMADSGAASREFEKGMYAPEVTRRTYEECLRRAEALFFEGQRVLVDASFRQDSQRRVFLEAARLRAVPAVFMVCRADPDLVRRRLDQRHGDVSDADWSIYLQMAARWEAPGPGISPLYLAAGDRPDQVLEQALSLLVASGLY